MVLYNCNKCNKQFDHLGNYKKHIIKKKPCNNPNKNVSQPKHIIIKKTGIKKIPINYDETKDNCPYCYKLITKKNIIRHIKITCKKAPLKTKEQIELKSNLTNIKQEISKVKKNKYIICNFGYESTNHISKLTLLNILSKQCFNITDLLDAIYIDYPQNRCFYMPNLYKDFVYVLKNNKYLLFNINKHTIDLANKSMLKLKILCESFEIPIPIFIDNYINQDTSILHDDIYKKCKVFIKSNSTLFKNFIKENG